MGFVKNGRKTFYNILIDNFTKQIYTAKYIKKAFPDNIKTVGGARLNG